MVILHYMNKDSRITHLSQYFMKPMAIAGLYGQQEYSKAVELAKMPNSQISLSVYKHMLAQHNPTIVSLNGAPIQVDSNFQLSQVRTNKIAKLNLKGVMLAEGDICSPSIDRLCEQILTVAYNPNLIGAVIDTNTGGGEVVAAQRVSNVLKEARTKKPFVQFVNGMSASGGNWSGCHCDEIVMGGNTTEIGSNGVVIDLNAEGVKWMSENIISVYADGSEDKRDILKAILRGDHEYVKTESLNPIRAEFHRVIKKGRKNIDPSVLTGKMYYAKEAIKLNMADSIGTFQDAAKRVVRLSKARAAQIAMKNGLN